MVRPGSCDHPWHWNASSLQQTTWSESGGSSRENQVQFLEEGMLHRVKKKKKKKTHMFIYVSIWNAETWKARVVLSKCLRTKRV